eukprot:TRINITY_DN39467_c0_g1_i1.p1 TRINITY_DN39467_c0_g1~~TRINITY_DN39467_c0_g1_i1.p1  ORF type:complete len:342 (+),score=62.08 TRINITY_DN39467_c0_g1_i1:156-1181(+)
MPGEENAGSDRQPGGSNVATPSSQMTVTKVPDQALQKRDFSSSGDLSLGKRSDEASALKTPGSSSSRSGKPVPTVTIAEWAPQKEDPMNEDIRFYEVQGSNPETEPADLRRTHAKLHSDAKTPLEMAVLAKLRAWEAGRDLHSIEDMMEVVRWMELKLVPRKEEPIWQRIMKKTSTKAKFTMCAIAMLCLLVFLIMLSSCTGLMLESLKIVAARPSGLLTLPELSGDGVRPAGVGEAVHMHSVFQYPSLAAEDLRRAQDVVFTHEGSFHFYRIASLAQTTGGGVRIRAEDNTRLLIQDGLLSFQRPWSPKELLPSGTSSMEGISFGTAGSFKALMPTNEYR